MKETFDVPGKGMTAVAEITHPINCTTELPHEFTRMISNHGRQKLNT